MAPPYIINMHKPINVDTHSSSHAAYIGSEHASSYMWVHCFEVLQLNYVSRLNWEVLGGKDGTKPKFTNLDEFKGGLDKLVEVKAYVEPLYASCWESSGGRGLFYAGPVGGLPKGIQAAIVSRMPH